MLRISSLGGYSNKALALSHCVFDRLRTRWFPPSASSSRFRSISVLSRDLICICLPSILRGLFRVSDCGRRLPLSVVLWCSSVLPEITPYLLMLPSEVLAECGGFEILFQSPKTPKLNRLLTRPRARTATPSKRDCPDVDCRHDCVSWKSGAKVCLRGTLNLVGNHSWMVRNWGVRVRGPIVMATHPPTLHDALCSDCSNPLVGNRTCTAAWTVPE